ILHGMTEASPPCWRMSRATASQASSLRLDMTTLAPSRTMASALARPMPRVDPVTIATLPSRLNGDRNSAVKVGPLSVMAFPIGLGEIFAQLLLGDGLAMDLVRAIGETQHTGARIRVSQVEILADAGAATDLDGTVDDVLGHVRGDDLNHSDFGPRGLVAGRVHHVGSVQRQQARLINLNARLGDPMARHAVIRNGATEGTAADSALAHGLQRTLGNADQPHAMMDAARAEPPLRNLEAAALAEKDVGHRHPHIVEYNFSVAMRGIVISENAERALDLHARRIERYQHHGLAAVALGLGIRHAHHDCDFTPAIHCTRGPPFAAVDDIVVAVTSDLGANIG